MTEDGFDELGPSPLATASSNRTADVRAALPALAASRNYEPGVPADARPASADARWSPSGSAARGVDLSAKAAGSCAAPRSWDG
jgi:hypothetical protein